MTKRESIIEKIKALLAKTVENGCTEAEMLAALARAQALQDAYVVTAEESGCAAPAFDGTDTNTVALRRGRRLKTAAPKVALSGGRFLASAVIVEPSGSTNVLLGASRSWYRYLAVGSSTTKRPKRCPVRSVNLYGVTHHQPQL